MSLSCFIYCTTRMIWAERTDIWNFGTPFPFVRGKRRFIKFGAIAATFPEFHNRFGCISFLVRDHLPIGVVKINAASSRRVTRNTHSVRYLITL